MRDDIIKSKINTVFTRAIRELRRRYNLRITKTGYGFRIYVGDLFEEEMESLEFILRHDFDLTCFPDGPEYVKVKPLKCLVRRLGEEQ